MFKIGMNYRRVGTIGGAWQVQENGTRSEERGVLAVGVGLREMRPTTIFLRYNYRGAAHLVGTAFAGSRQGDQAAAWRGPKPSTAFAFCPLSFLSIAVKCFRNPGPWFQWSGTSG